MAAVSSVAPITEERSGSLLSLKRDSVSDLEVGVADVSARGRADIPVTSVGSTDDSHGLSTPECDSIEVKMTPVSRWSNVQEALEACLDPFFLVGQSSVKDDSIVEEVVQLLDTSLTAHVPALANLSFLQPFFCGRTRSERLDAVLGAARASNKLLLRDDLPVPSTSSFMLSVDEAEAAGLRVGPRSHAEGANRCVLCLERKHGATDAGETLKKYTLSQLQSTVPQHKIVMIERLESPSVVQVVFVTLTAADRAYAVWRAHAPHPDIRVTRVSGSKPMPAPPRSATAGMVAAATGAAPTPTVPAPRTVLKCPRVVGEALSRPSSSENVADMPDKVASFIGAAAVAPRAAVPVPKPPPAIDAVLPISATSATSPAASSDSSTTATTPSPESSTTKSKFNTNATPFLPKSVLDAQMAAASWWPQRGSRSRLTPCCEEVSSAAIDTSEALANQMLMDSSNGWMYPRLDPYGGPAWARKFGPVCGWMEGGDMSVLPSADAACKEDLVMTERPKAIGGEMPVAPRALGDSPNANNLRPVARADLYPPRPTAMSLPPEQVGGCGSSCAYDGLCAARNSPLSQSSPVSLSTSRRHRHDPYSPTGFVLCTESSCASSLSHPPGGNTSLTPSSNKLLFAGSLTGEKMASFCFEDPLIKASARRRERRRLMQAEEEGGAACTSSPMERNSSLSNLDEAQSMQAGSSSSSAGDVAAQRNGGCLVATDAEASLSILTAEAAEAAAAVAEITSAAAPAESPAPTPHPKSYAEALRLKVKSSVPAVASAKPAEAKKKTGKAATATTRSADAADSKSGSAISKVANARAVKLLSKLKKATVATR